MSVTRLSVARWSECVRSPARHGRSRPFVIKGSADGRPCDVVPAFDYQSPRAAARMERRSQIPTGGPTPGRRDARILSRHFTSLWPSYRPWTAACGKDGLERRWSRRRPWHSPTLSGGSAHQTPGSATAASEATRRCRYQPRGPTCLNESPASRYPNRPRGCSAPISVGLPALHGGREWSLR